MEFQLTLISHYVLQCSRLYQLIAIFLTCQLSRITILLTNLGQAHRHPFLHPGAAQATKVNGQVRNDANADNKQCSSILLLGAAAKECALFAKRQLLRVDNSQLFLGVHTPPHRPERLKAKTMNCLGAEGVVQIVYRTKK